MSTPRLRAAAAMLTAFAAALLFVPGGVGTPAAAATSLPPIRHVWIVMLENESDANAFESTQNSYLPSLRAQGAYIPGYFGTGHQSLDNYIALMSGQGANSDTQGDCQVYQDVAPGQADGAAYGQTTASSGCVYPSGTRTLVDQLSALGYSWKGYMEDMGQDSGRDAPVTCSKPATPVRDPTQSAEGPSSSNGNQGDQYAVRHDPFMYFHSIIDNAQACTAHVVRLQDGATGLVHDLGSTLTTPSFSFVTPNLCDDGHDPSSASTTQTCAAPDAGGRSSAGGLTAIDDFLSIYVPQIVHSPAFQKDGMLVVTFDESTASDASGCCDEQSGQNTGSAGISGQGGGQVGAVVLSPFVKPGTRAALRQYNHYSLLRTLEDIFHTTGGDDGDGHLGFAGNYHDGYSPCDMTVKPCQPDFGADVFTDPSGRSRPLATPAASPGGPGAGAPAPLSAPPPGDAAPPAGVDGSGVPPASPQPGAPAQSPTTSAAQPAVTGVRRTSVLGPALDTPALPVGLLSILLIAPLAAMAAATILIRRRRAT